ncbi:MAG: LysR family transcriptional regulator [Variovorax sp.]|jgi:DNA-binding transcriptional LysR family regulator|nr:MAG: LysR family transcriptional regulator [Variovorax sp.]
MRAIADLQLLRAFVTVARDGSVSRAAAHLHLSQPAVSLQLKSLAEQLGLTLFRRLPRGLELTPEGLALLPRAERVLSSLADFNHAAIRLQDAVVGTLRLGTILDPAFIRLGEFLRRMVEAAPHAQIELRQAMSGDVIAQIDDGRLDAGFHLDASAPAGAGAYADRFAVRLLTPFTYRVVAPPGWASRVAGQDWHGLASLPWLSTPEQSVHHRLLAGVFGPGSLTGMAPPRVARVDQEASMIDLVKSGIGLSLMRDSIAIRESQAFGLAIADRVGLDCALTFVCLRERRHEPVVAAAWEALASVWGPA